MVLLRFCRKSIQLVGDGLLCRRGEDEMCEQGSSCRVAKHVMSSFMSQTLEQQHSRLMVSILTVIKQPVELSFQLCDFQERRTPTHVQTPVKSVTGKLKQRSSCTPVNRNPRHTQTGVEFMQRSIRDDCKLYINHQANIPILVDLHETPPEITTKSVALLLCTYL